MLLPSAFYSVLLSLLGSFEIPTTLVTHLCASPGKLVEFNKHLLVHRPTLIRHLHSLSQLDELREHDVLVIVNLSCRGLKAELREKGNERKLNFNYRWFMVDLENIVESQQKSIDLFSNIPILHSSEIYFCNVKDKEDTFEIKRMYRNSIASPLVIEPIYEGSLANPSVIHWTRKDPSTAVSRLLPPGLDGTLLRVTMTMNQNDSMNHLMDYVDPHIDSLNKMGYILNAHLTHILNATVVYSRSDGWGYTNNVTGEINGMAGELIRQEADLAATVWFANEMRNGHLQFVSMAIPIKLALLFQAPKLTMTDNVFLLPFHWMVWVSVVLMVLILIPALKFSLYAEHRRLEALERDSADGISRTDWNEVSTVIIGSTCQQGLGVNYFSVSARIVLITALLGFMLIHSSFSAHIIGLIQSPSSRIKTLQDLTESRLSVGYEDTGYNRFYYPNEMEPVRRSLYLTKIHKKKKGQDAAYTMEEGVELIRQGLFAFQAELGVAYKFVADTYQEHEKCNLKEIHYYDANGLWYGLRKNSTLRRVVTLAMFRIREFGIQDREDNLIHYKTPTCHGSGDSFLSIGLVDVSPAFLFLLWGFLVSVIVLGIEFLFHYLICN